MKVLFIIGILLNGLLYADDLDKEKANKILKEMTDELIAINRELIESDRAKQRSCEATNFTLTGDFVRYKNGVVIDKITNLMWADNNDTKYIKYDFFKAWEHCRELKTGGFDNWSQPNRRELLSIVDTNHHNPASNSIFENVATGAYWTDTQLSSSHAKQLWTVEFYDGNTSSGYYKDEKHYSLCVRKIKMNDLKRMKNDKN
jgi:hypothetical protein